MVREVRQHSQCTVTWQTKMELAWQSSVTIVRVENMWEDMNNKGATHGPFSTQERVSLSWPISPASLRIVNSLSSTSVITRRYSETTDLLGGCHVILLRWRTGVEHPSMVIAHAGWPTHVQTPVMAVTVMIKNYYAWREESCLLTDKTKLSVKQLRFGDTRLFWEKGYQTLGKQKCYGTA